VVQIGIAIGIPAAKEDFPFKLHYRAMNETASAIYRSASDSSMKSGWTIIQHRVFDHSPSFESSGWELYKVGFGIPMSSEYWLGLEQMHQITSTGRWKLLLSYQYKNGKYAWMILENFKVHDESTGYTLHLGALREVFNMKRNDFEMRYSSGKKFRTKDNSDKDNCPTRTKGGWWFLNCAYYCANCMEQVNRDAENKKIAIQEINMAIMEI